MEPYAQAAKKLSLLFNYGVISESEIIDWADDQLIAMQSPPDRLLELASVHPTDTASIISHLHALSEEAEFWPAFREVLARLHQHVVAHPQDAERIAHCLYRTILMFSDVPAEFSFANRFDDAFSLAREGIAGDEATVLQEFVDELQRFATPK